MALICYFDDIVQKLCSTAYYTCQIKKKEIPEGFVTFKGIHKEGKGNDDVIKISFIDCKVPKFPQGIGETFKNIQILILRKAGLRSINKFDLRFFENLIHLDLNENDLEYLPGDLFEFNPKLKRIYFCENKLKFIGPELLDNHPNLERAYFKKNLNINYLYNDSYESASFNHLKKLIEIIQRDCRPRGNKFRRVSVDESSEEATTSTQNIIKQSSLDDFSDFTIIVGNHEFKVHKFIMETRSETFAEYFKSNPDAEKLELKDFSVEFGISAEIFNCILKLIYSNKLETSEDIYEVLEAAYNLKIKGVATFTGSYLLNKVKCETNLKVLLKILKLASNFNQNELKLKAFEEIKKQFKGKILPDELAEDLEDLEEFINAKLKLDQLKNL